MHEAGCVTSVGRKQGEIMELEEIFTFNSQSGIPALALSSTSFSQSIKASSYS